MRNWAGNVEYRARRLLEPRSMDELRDHVRAADRFRVLGSRHAFNAIADTDGDLISLARLPRHVEIDRAAMTVTVDGGIRYGDLAPLLDEAGLALDNLASLPHISVAGACATGTHGSGVRSRALPGAVRSVELLRTDGETVTFDRDADPGTFPGIPVSLGAMGVVTRLTLDVLPRYDVEQRVYEDLPLTALRGRFDDVLAAADSVSLFTTWRDDVVDQVWVKRRVAAGDAGSRAPRVPPCRPRSSPPGRPADRGIRFRAWTRPRAPSSSACPGRGTSACRTSASTTSRAPATSSRASGSSTRATSRTRSTRCTRSGAGRHRSLLVSEIRTVAADDLWLSPAYGRPSVAFHFTWRPDWAAVRPAIEAIETALAPFEPRPHWAKLFAMAPEAVAAAYPRHADARSLATTLDPAGKLRNAFLDRYLFAGGTASG